MKLDDTNYKIKMQLVMQTDCVSSLAEKGVKTLRKVQTIITAETTGTRSQPYQTLKMADSCKRNPSPG